MKKKYVIIASILIVVFFIAIVFYSNYVNKLTYNPVDNNMNTTDVENNNIDNSKINNNEEENENSNINRSKMGTKTNNNSNGSNNSNSGNGSSNNTTTSKIRNEHVELVSKGGWIKVNGNDLVDQHNNLIQLKGVSSHGLQWYSNLITKENLSILKNEWNNNVFRLAFYTEENGYISNKNLKNTLIEKIDLIVSMDMYVIVDWHILKDGDPNTHINEAKEFFDEISKKYSNTPNVIYEICNEPNGSSIHWDTHIKPYADEIVKVIRNNSNGLIIVGTETYSKGIMQPLYNKVNDNNVIYALHFYSGTDTDSLRDKMKTARSNGLPVIVSEFGITRNTGTGGLYPTEADKWIKQLDEYNISYINWSLSNKNESSALLKTGTTILKDENLSEAGKYIKNIMKS